MQFGDYPNPNSSPVIGVSPSPGTGQLFDNPMAPVAAATTSHLHLDNDESSATRNNNNASLNSGSCSYDEIFPALPDSGSHHHFQQQVNNANSVAAAVGWRDNKMRVGSSDITQVYQL